MCHTFDGSYYCDGEGGILVALGVNVTVNDRLSGLMARVTFLKSFREVTVAEFACGLSLTVIFPPGPYIFSFLYHLML